MKMVSWRTLHKCPKSTLAMILYQRNEGHIWLIILLLWKSKGTLKDHPWLFPNILDITEWWSHLCRQSFSYLNAIEHYEFSLPKMGIQPINILCWNGRRIRAFHLLWAPPKGLGNNFPKWCMISSEILSMLSKTTPYFDTTNLMNFLFHMPLATLWKNL